MRQWRFIHFVIPIILLGGVFGAHVTAQESAPRGRPIVDGVTVEAGDLDGPRGFLVSPEGNLFVALAGSGGAERGSGIVPDGPLMGGLTAGVVLVEQGCEQVLATGLPSTISGMGDSWGVADLAEVGDQLYALVAGGGAAHGNRDDPNGVYRITEDGEVVLVADLSAWQRENPVAVLPVLDRVPDGMPVSMDVVGEELWIVERFHGQLLGVAVDGTIRRIIDFSSTGLVPGGIATLPDGGVLLAVTGSPPYPADTASIVSIGPDGSMTDVWTGLTAPVDVAISPTGVLYALELGVPESIVPPYLAGQSGRVVQQTGPDSSALVAERLDRPSSIEVGSDGGIYVALPSTGSQGGDGAILRIEPDLEDAVTVPPGPWRGPECEENEASDASAGE